MFKKLPQNKYIFEILSVFILVMCFLPVLMLGGIPVNIRDGFEANWGLLDVLNNSHAWTFGTYEKVAGLGDGFPRVVFPTEFFLTSFLHMVMSPLAAYLTAYTLIFTTAFLSMRLLLKEVVPGIDSGVCWLVAATFAAVPVWTPAALSIPALPLFVWAFLRLFDSGSRYKFLYVLPAVALPFVGNFFMLYIFVIPLMGMFWLWKIYRNRTIYFLPAVYLALATLFFVVTEYRLFESFLLGGNAEFVSNRVERDIARYDFGTAAAKFFRFFTNWNDPVEAPIHQKFIMPVILLVPLLMLWKKRVSFLYISLLGLFAVMGAILAFWRWEGAAWLQEFYFIKTVNWSRFHWAAPVVLYVLLGLCARIVWETKKPVLKWGFALVIVAQAMYNLSFRPTGHMFDAATPSFAQFYAENQYPALIERMRRDTVEPVILHVGLPSTISMYHHLDVLDFYATNYPVGYKKDFRGIIAGELAKSPKLTYTYDDWGDRVYMFSADMLQQSFVYFAPRYKSEGYVLRDNAFNWDAARKLGATHIVSAVKIEDDALQSEGYYGDSDSYWNIYLYKL